MTPSQTVLSLLDRRVQLQEALKASLKKQQQLLVDNNTNGINEVAGEQLAILESVQEAELAWQELLNTNFTPQQLAHPPLPFSERFGISEAETGRAKRLQQRLSDLLDEIAELRDTNRLLMNRSLGFIRGIFKRLADQPETHAVYRRNKKGASATVLINRVI